MKESAREWKGSPPLPGDRRVPESVRLVSRRAVALLVAAGAVGASSALRLAAKALEPKARQPNGVGEPSQAAIAQRAYELYLARGRAAGHELDDWLRAESELRQGPRSRRPPRKA